MTGWDELERELDAWAAAGRRAEFWWRDDDAIEWSAALDRLLALSAAHGAPLCLAVIPARVQPALAPRLAAYPNVAPVQHGYAHTDHSIGGSKTGELGPNRPREQVLAELAHGSERLKALFGAAFRPVLVPPWNRIDPALLPHLPDTGFRAVSTFGPRPAAEPAAGLVQVNTHLDIVDWRRSRGFVGEAKALGRLVEHLRARRTGAADAAEPTGLLTHHLVHDETCWSFIAALLARTGAHPAAHWRAVDAMIALAPRADPVISIPV